MADTPSSLTGLRLSNRRQILEVLRHRGTTSRAEIAKRTGLSTTTVSTLVSELLDESIVVELGDRRTSASGGGRPARVLAFNPAAGGAVGVHLAHDHVRVGVTDLAGNVVAQTLSEIDVDHEPTRTLALVGGTALELIAESGVRKDGIVGLGVAVSAPMPSASAGPGVGRILADWHSVDVGAELSRRTGFSVEIGNDANLGAIAEQRFGAAQGVDDFVYVMLSDGVGAGLILDGHLYEGALGGAGEFGHITVAPDGYVCRCGNRGCLETVVGAKALVSALALTRGDSTVPDIVRAAAAGEEGARRVLSDAGTAVGRALVPLCTVLDPALVVIGGAGGASPALIDAVQDALVRGMTPLRGTPVAVRAGALGDEAEMLGAVTLATQRMNLT
ncbi:MAG TPA: ROK family transcriptional regulator [Jatrophihabitans sp.]|nr:ROK family transcriptional regulator [Jatrophihabitans sp.]